MCQYHSAKLITALTRFPEQELWEIEHTLIDMEHPGIAAWCLDYHVFTVGLNRGGVVHTKFATALDPVYSFLCEPQVGGPVSAAAPVVGDLVEMMFHWDQDVASQDAFLVWKALLSWTIGCENGCEPPVDTLVRLAYA